MAIIFVVTFHALYAIYKNNSLRILGFFGISLFFMISGFVLAKNYPKLKNFSIKWFFKRYIRIASLYYLAIITILFLFKTQSYTPPLERNLLLHFLFIDFISPTTAYGFISPAWFLTPLIGLYILFPYLNRLIKKSNIFLILAFAIMMITRLLEGTFTSFSPLFFLGEFCFGIALAHNKKHYPFLISFMTLIILINYPLNFGIAMIIPFIIFYILIGFNPKLLNTKILTFIGMQTFVIFLFHESFINIAIGKWHMYNLTMTSAISILIAVTIICGYISIIIRNVFEKILDLPQSEHAKNSKDFKKSK